MRDPIYLDYSATTPPRPQVREAMARFLEPGFGNPSSIHSFGRNAKAALEEARQRLLTVLAANTAKLVFTGSGSEADNLAVLGFARRHPDGCVIRSTVEHKAVVAAGAALATTGYDVRMAPVDSRCVLDVAELKRLLPTDGRPTLVSVMWANNETGVVQPIAAIAEACRERGALFHSDAVQALGKIPVAPEAAGVHLTAFSAHKLAGPVGTGALLIAADTELEPLAYGGGHEAGLRPGTENVAGIVGFAVAADIAHQELAQESSRLAQLRDGLEAGLKSAIPEIVVNGGDAPQRLPTVSNISIPDVDIEGLLTSLDLEGICISSGSACTTGSVEPSHVMMAMGREGDLARNSMRISVGWGTREPDIEYVLERFPAILQRVREFSSPG
jgi:cysteine desulfurase